MFELRHRTTGVHTYYHCSEEAHTTKAEDIDISTIVRQNLLVGYT